MTEPGCYVLVVKLQHKRAIRVGMLGKVEFPSGTYLYAGSARNGLKRRLSHHLKRPKRRKHWHIDYLLSRPQAKITKIFLYPASGLRECEIVQRLKKIPGAQTIAKGFGTSDCVSGCGSHLIYLPQGRYFLG